MMIEGPEKFLQAVRCKYCNNQYFSRNSRLRLHNFKALVDNFPDPVGHFGAIKTPRALEEKKWMDGQT